MIKQLPVTALFDIVNAARPNATSRANPRFINIPGLEKIIGASFKSSYFYIAG
ncbi:hypothetical protein [Mucilaginibacter flavus]|uniref:hypothetical protein n=1 Tax=Mucilaginibacter flavus TaxID=931504 RepID=UPI0025B3E706|nr:hypothetical protein [Mucilaginibacter flavus]